MDWRACGSRRRRRAGRTGCRGRDGGDSEGLGVVVEGEEEEVKNAKSKGAGRNVSTCRSSCGDATGDGDGSRGVEDRESGENAGESGQTNSDCAAADKGCQSSYKGPARRTWRLEPFEGNARPREGRRFHLSRAGVCLSLQQKKGSLPLVTARINPPTEVGAGAKGDRGYATIDPVHFGLCS